MVNNIFSGSIYLISNDINDKKYVGQTTRSIERRFNEHCWCSGCRKLHNAILKYGKEHFTIKPLKVFSCSSQLILEEQLNKWETFYIKYYDTVNTGYNLSNGGDHYKMSEETKHRLSKSKQASKKPVNQYDDEGNLIASYESLKEATIKFTSSKHQGHIADVCNGKRKKCYGYIWRWKV